MKQGEFIKIDGSCHCCNIRFVLAWPAPVTEIAIRSCGCTFCVKHAGAWTSHPGAKLSVTIDDQNFVVKYQFGTKTADFYICSTCGVVPFVISELDSKIYAVVNVNVFENTDELSFSKTSTNFDGEDTGSRLDRRKRNWIPTVELM